MARLRLALLGGFEARFDAGHPIPLARHKVEALLSLLALPTGQLHRRDMLAALLWPDAPGPRARQSLRQALAELRLALAPAAPCLIERRDAVGLDPSAVEVDVAEFERLVGDGALEDAMALYRGDLLEGLRIAAPPFEEWLMRERERLREVALEALARLLRGHLASNAPGPAVQTALRLLALDPLQESVHRTLMRLYLRLGRRGAGLRQYQACLDRLHRELDTEPEDETRMLYLELLQSPAAPHTAPADGPATGTIAAEAIHPGPLLGRGADLAGLGLAYEQAREGGRPVIAIVGEAGIGKTRLVEEFIATLSSRDVRVLIGRAHETEADLPFGLWIQMLRDAGVLADAVRLLNGTRWARTEISRLFPEVAQPGDSAGVSADRGPLFEAMGQLLAGLGRPGLLLVLEDVHWADEPSLRLLAFVLRRITGGRLAVVLSAREEEMSSTPALRQVLGELDRDGLLFTLALTPLGREAAVGLVRSLARAGADAAGLESQSEQIWRVSGGNPFMIVETVRALQEGGRTGPAADLPLPKRVHDTISWRLDRLTDRSRAVVGVAAAIGRRFEFAVLRDSAGVDPAEAAAAVEELVGRRILHVVGERLDFTHDWIRRTAYERVLPPVRPTIHASVARALERLHADRPEDMTDELAYHYARANEPSNAVAALRRFAVAACGRYALEEAIRALDEALRHVDGLAGTLRVRARVEVTLEIALALSVVGRFEEIVERLTPLREAVSELADPVITGRYLSRIALTESILGRHDRAEDTARRALAEAERSDDAATLGTARYVLAVKGFVSGEARTGLEHARHAVAALDRAQDRAWLAQACWILGYNHYLLGELDAAVEAGSRMEAIAQGLGDRGREATAAWSIALFEGTRGHVEVARAAGRRALERSPDTPNRATAQAILAMVDIEAGDSSGAVTVLEAAVRALDGFRLRQAMTALFLAEAYRLECRLGEARDVAGRTREMSRRMSFAWAHAVAERALGRIALDAGDVGAALRHLETARQLFAAMSARFELGRTHLDLALAAGERPPGRVAAPPGAAVVGAEPCATNDLLDVAAHVRAARRLFAAAHAPRYIARAERLT